MAGRGLLARFLRLFGFCSRSSSGQHPDNQSAPAPSVVPLVELAPINDIERLSRFVAMRDHYQSEKNEIRWRAFLPARNADNLSISRTEGLSEDEIWPFADGVVGAAAERTIIARGDFYRLDVERQGADGWRLRVRSNEPPPRHALILGWPPPAENEARKMLAQELRACATAFGRPG